MVRHLARRRSARKAAAAMWLALAYRIASSAGLGMVAPLVPGMAAGPASAALSHCPAGLATGPEHPLVHPVVSGAAGPFARARVTLVGATALAGLFTGRLDVPGGRCFPLAGPDDPTGLFDFFVTAVVFTPLPAAQANGIVVLYNKVHRSPEPDDEPSALVYRVDGNGASRVPVLEQRLEGVRNAAQVRHRLAGPAAGHDG